MVTSDGRFWWTSSYVDRACYHSAIALNGIRQKCCYSTGYSSTGLLSPIPAGTLLIGQPNGGFVYNTVYDHLLWTSPCPQMFTLSGCLYILLAVWWVRVGCPHWLLHPIWHALLPVLSAETKQWWIRLCRTSIPWVNGHYWSLLMVQELSSPHVTWFCNYSTLSI